MDQLRSAYYLRLVVQDKPRVLGQIATAFGDYDVSLAAMEMKTIDERRGEIAFLTHQCQESSFTAALAVLKSTGVVEEVSAWFRVDEDPGR